MMLLFLGGIYSWLSALLREKSQTNTKTCRATTVGQVPELIIRSVDHCISDLKVSIGGSVTGSGHHKKKKILQYEYKLLYKTNVLRYLDLFGIAFRDEYFTSKLIHTKSVKNMSISINMAELL